MRKMLLAIMATTSCSALAQDSLQTTTLKEVVVTGTKFDVPVEKSGKSIYKLTSEDLANNAGKSLADVLNEVPGIQMDNNFSTPGSNVSYYLRGGRNKHTLILIDGVPLNDPSAINAEYDLRYIPISQIESIEVLKGGLSTLYGTNAAAGVINIRLKEPTENLAGRVDVNAGSFNTFGADAQVSGTLGKFSVLLSRSNTVSRGFSAALDTDLATEFDDDGFSRQNNLIKVGFRQSENFNVGLHAAYEAFEAEYDDFEFTDGDNKQIYQQFRIGLTPEYKYGRGSLSGKFFYNENDREFRSDYPSNPEGKNFQGELIHRHRFGTVFQSLIGVNVQNLTYIEEQQQIDEAFTFVDPYVSLFIDLPSGLNVHAGARLNTHSVYGSKFLYNVNPSFVLNQNGRWNYKVFGSVATSFIAPSLFQLYSIYGNTELDPEESVNTEAGLSVYHDKLTINAAWYNRNEIDPIDFVNVFDDQGNYVGSRYENVTNDRRVFGVEFDVQYRPVSWLTLGANFATVDSDKMETLNRIPMRKFGMLATVTPVKPLNVTVKYNHTGDRNTRYWLVPEPIVLHRFDLVDVFASYQILADQLSVYAAANNVFNEAFIGVYGYTTRGRNFNVGVRYEF